MLESKDLTKKFGSKTAVDQVSLLLEVGHTYGMLGPNGSGKTTWMKMAAGLIKPTAGAVYFQGQPVGVESRRHVAYMSTEPYFYQWMNCISAGKYYADFFADFSLEKYRNMLRDMELEEKSKIKSLSTGMMAKLKIALTLSRDAQVLMLDEPFNGIDLLTRDQIREEILKAARPDRLILLSSHLVEEMETIVDRAVFIRKGALVQVQNLTDMHDKDGLSMADAYRAIFGRTEATEAC